MMTLTPPDGAAAAAALGQDLAARLSALRRQVETAISDLGEQIVAYLNENSGSKEWMSAVTSESDTDFNFNLLIQNSKANRDETFGQVLLFLNNGTVTHWVYPREGNTLHWVEDGEDHFSKGHQVSGIAPRNFLEHATEMAQQLAAQNVAPLLTA